MRIGVLTAMSNDEPLGDVIARLKGLGVQAVEIGTGNYPRNGHCNAQKLLVDHKGRGDFLRLLSDNGLTLSALSCHGNPLHPDKAIADEHHKVWRDTLELAKTINLKRVITFSGLPGDPESCGKVPIWVTAPWPEEQLELRRRQWERSIIPYWFVEAKEADAAGVDICFEMHPNMAVYNPETLLWLRRACGDRICCNLDPSHLFWQGMNPLEVIRLLGGKIIKHVHAKDVRLDPRNVALNGVLDAKHYGEVLDRAHVFCTLGYGHGLDFWNAFVVMLRQVGYDDVLSIEHEDGGMSAREGLTKAVQLLVACILNDPPGEMTWA